MNNEVKLRGWIARDKDGALTKQQSEAYAEARLKPYGATLLKAEAKALIAEAYEQGWVDRDTRDMKPETEDEFFNGE